MPPLRELQFSFFRSLATSPGASTGFDPLVLGHIEGNANLSSAERFNIYAQMYFARVVDVLSQNFPRVYAILGFDQFQNLVRDYIAQYPSMYPTIQDVGERFADFVATCQTRKIPPFLADLACLEWLRLEVFDAPDAEPLQLEDLQTIAPDDWPNLHFQLIPASQVFHSTWPVHSLWAAQDTDQPGADVQPQATTVRIWRHDFLIYQTVMVQTEQLAFEAVQAGESFAGVCAALEAVVSSEEAPQEMGSLLLRWIEDGVLARLETS